MIVEEINRFYERKNIEKERDYFYCSEVDNCPRAIYFAFKKTPKLKLEPLVYQRFAGGDYTHMRLMSVLFSLRLAKAVEIKIPSGELFRGRADAIIVINNEPYVVEIKSMNSFGFKKLTEANPSHVKQLQLYLHFLNVDKGIILVENKDTQELKEFIINKDPELIKELLNDFKELKDKIGKNELPEIPKNLEPWKCNYCAYSKVCEKK